MVTIFFCLLVSGGEQAYATLAESGEGHAGLAIEEAVRSTLASGVRTADMLVEEAGPATGTAEFTDNVLARISARRGGGRGMSDVSGNAAKTG